MESELIFKIIFVFVVEPQNSAKSLLEVGELNSNGTFG